MSYDSASDIGVLLLGGTEDFVKTLSLQLSIASPKVGETVKLYGFHKITADIIIDESGRILSGGVNTCSAAFSTGVVEEVHTLYRDKGMLRFPCFRTNVRAEHSMSGGPIINKAGYVCGLISSAFEHEDEVEYTSYGSLLYPAMTSHTMFRVGNNVKQLKMLECMQKNIILSDGSYKYFKEKTKGSVEINFDKLNMEEPTSAEIDYYMSNVYKVD